MKIDEIKKLFGEARYDEGFEACEELLRDQLRTPEEVLRVRAYGRARVGDYEGAVSDYDNIVRGGQATISDYYLAGYNYLFIQNYSRASELFQRVLEMADKSNDTWFTSAAWFYLSYSQIELGAFDEALKSIESLTRFKSEGRLPLPDGSWCSYSQLRDKIIRRRR